MKRKIESRNNLIKNIKEISLAITIAILFACVILSLFGGFLYFINIDNHNLQRQEFERQIKDLNTKIIELQESNTNPVIKNYYWDKNVSDWLVK